MTQPLSTHQLLMLRESGFDPYDGQGFGVDLTTAGHWRTARALERRGLGWTAGGHANGSDLPGLFYANRKGAAITHPDESHAWHERRGE